MYSPKINLDIPLSMMYTLCMNMKLKSIESEVKAMKHYVVDVYHGNNAWTTYTWQNIFDVWIIKVLYFWKVVNVTEV